jgi:polyisoprenoid-binding protein YceI
MIKRLLAVSALLAIAVAARAATETYKIDPVHSAASFSLFHMISKFKSSFTSVNGTITVDRANLENSSVTASIDVGALNTANEKRDDDLKSPNYFDVAKFPSMTFTSKAWKKTGENTYDVTGDLTIKDVTKEVVLHVTSLGFAPGRPGTTLSAWEATTELKRTDFHVSGPSKFLGDDVSIDITIEADAKS